MSVAPAPPAPKVRPSATWIIVAIILLIVGPGGCSVVLVTQAVDLLDEFDAYGRYDLPTESSVVTIPEPVVDGAIFVRGETTATQLRVRGRVRPEIVVNMPGDVAALLNAPR